MRKKFFPDLHIVVAYEDKRSIQSKLNWVSSNAIRKDSYDLIEWPSGIKYMWNQTDPKASKTVLLSSYDI